MPHPLSVTQSSTEFLLRAGRSIGSSLLLGTALLCMATTTTAQEPHIYENPEFRLAPLMHNLPDTGSPLKVFPGSFARLGVYVKYKVFNPNAVNFTVDVTQGSQYVKADFHGGSYISSPPTDFDGNSLKVGGKWQYRAIIDGQRGDLYAGTDPMQQEVLVGWVDVHVCESTPVPSTIKLKLANTFDSSGLVALTAVSDLTLKSVNQFTGVPSPGAPCGVSVTPSEVELRVEPQLTIGNSQPAGWVFHQLFPAVNVQECFTPTYSSDGLTVVLKTPNPGDNSIQVTDLMVADFENSESNRIPSPGADKIVLYRWSARAHQAGTSDKLPVLRLRSQNWDYAQTQMVLFQNNYEANPATILLPPEDVTFNYEGAFYVPGSASNGLPSDSDGIRFTFDIFGSGGAPGFGNYGDKITIKSAGYTVLSESDLPAIDPLPGAPIDHIQTGEFHALPIAGGDDFSPTVMTDELMPDGNHVLLTSLGTTDGTSNTTGYGNWERNGVSLPEHRDKIYKVEFTVASTADLAANTRHKSPNLRVRFSILNFNYVAYIEIDSQQDKTGDPAYPVSKEQSYKGYVMFPNEWDGENLTISLDAYWLEPRENAIDTGSVSWKSLKLTGYHLPRVSRNAGVPCSQ